MLNKNTSSDNPPELGLVPWRRDFSSALDDAGKSGKLVLLLFQEIPGCRTCTDFGKNVLSNGDFIAFVMESFIPVAVYNNRPGSDVEILQRYNEPAWNNPVIRVVDGSGQDIIERIADCYEPVSLIRKLKSALPST